MANARTYLVGLKYMSYTAETKDMSFSKGRDNMYGS